MRLTSTMAARDLERPVNMSKDPAAGAARGDDLDAESLPAAPRLFRVSATAGSTAVAADRAGRPDADTMIGRSAGPARRGGTVGSAMRRSPAAAVSGAAGRARQTGRQTAAGVCHGGRGEPRRAAAAAAPSVASVAGPQSHGDCHRDSDAGDSGRGPVPRPGRGHCQSR